MALGRTLSTNFALQLLGKGASALLGLVLVALLTRALGPLGYGEYTTAITYLQFFGVIVDFGLTLTLMVMISESGADEEKVAGNILGLRLVSAAILFALAPVIAMPIPWSPAVKAAIAVGAVAYFLMSGATVLVGVFQRHAAIWRASVAELASRVLLVAATAALAYAHAGLVAMFVALVVANVIWLALTVLLARPLVRLRPLFDFAAWKTVISRSWPIAISIAFNLIYLKGDVIIISLIRTQQEVGFYGVAYRFLDVLTALPTMFMGLMLPSLVADWTAARREEFSRHMARAFDVFALACAPIVFGGIAIAPQLIGLIAGPGFEDAVPAMRILMLAVPGIFLGALYGHAVVGVGRQRQMISGYAVTAILTIAAYLAVIPRWGIEGAAWATVASELLIAFLTYRMVRHAGSAAPSLSIALRSLLAAGGMYVLLQLIPGMSAVASLVVGACSYMAFAYALGAIRKEDLRMLIPHRSPDFTRE